MCVVHDGNLQLARVWCERELPCVQLQLCFAVHRRALPAGDCVHERRRLQRARCERERDVPDVHVHVQPRVDGADVRCIERVHQRRRLQRARDDREREPAIVCVHVRSWVGRRELCDASVRAGGGLQRDWDFGRCGSVPELRVQVL